MKKINDLKHLQEIYEDLNSGLGINGEDLK